MRYSVYQLYMQSCSACSRRDACCERQVGPEGDNRTLRAVAMNVGAHHKGQQRVHLYYGCSTVVLIGYLSGNDRRSSHVKGST